MKSQAVFHGNLDFGTTILDSIKAAVGDKTEVVYKENPSPGTFATGDFCYAIVAIGEAPYAESVGDNGELTIPFSGADLITMVADRVLTLAILISGRPLLLEEKLLEKLDRLIAAWLPGSDGEGIADIIFGDYEFQGRLPVSWFKSVDQLPMNAKQNSHDPLFPIGFGLKGSAES